MADKNEFSKDLLAVLAKHGVQGLPQDVTAARAVRPEAGGQAASEYITSIIKGDQAFSEETLARVTGVLNRGALSKVGGGG